MINKEYYQLQQILSKSNLVGTPRLLGKEATPLTPQFLICADCNNNMTSYQNKVKNLYYYKCNQCNKTVNAETFSKSMNKGVHEQFNELLNKFCFPSEMHDLFTAQLNKLIQDDMSTISERKRILSREINDLKVSYDKMEYRYAINEISKDIFERQGKKLKEEIENKIRELNFIPSKKSNLEKALNYFLKINENPSKFYHSLDYSKKRKFQKLMFPNGLLFSLEKKRNLTSKTSLIFELTNSFSMNYEQKKERTHQQKANKSVLVHYINNKSNLFLELEKISSLFEKK